MLHGDTQPSHITCMLRFCLLGLHCSFTFSCRRLLFVDASYVEIREAHVHALSCHPRSGVSIANQIKCESTTCFSHLHYPWRHATSSLSLVELCILNGHARDMSHWLRQLLSVEAHLHFSFHRFEAGCAALRNIWMAHEFFFSATLRNA